MRHDWSRPGAAVCSVLLLAVASVAGAQQASVPPAIDPAQIVQEHPGMVLVPAGEFKMGSGPDEAWVNEDEGPQRVVNLPAFFIDQLEVTNREYKQFIDATGWPAPQSWTKNQYPENADFVPVTSVTWWDATAYARWAKKRLPTEAEWEKAARGVDGRRYPWGDEFKAECANNDRDLLPGGTKVAGASPFGVLDMAGNAAEWTASAYELYPRPGADLPREFGGVTANTAAATTVRDASIVPAPGSKVQPGRGKVKAKDTRLMFFTAEELADDRPRSYRGGSYNSYAKFLRSAYRGHEAPGSRWPNIGFRCALDAPGAGESVK